MSRYKCILFDCMETVIDVIEKPDLRLYVLGLFRPVMNLYGKALMPCTKL